VYGYDQRVEVLGSTGGATVSNNHPNTAVISDAGNVHCDLPLNFFMDRYLDSFMTEMRDFVDAVLDDKPTPVTGIDGRAAVALGIAARRSYDENRAVRLEEIE
jgi:myo-inositol 2-dehydrogenase / D-chiro-inositol 1-dehydrogenase